LTGSGAQVSHVPVLLEEVLEGLRVRQGGVYLDGTLGAGGHAAEILARCPSAMVLGLDLDPAALKVASAKLSVFGDRVRLIHGDFRDLAEILQSNGIREVDGIVLDLGVSSMQLDLPARGFSFMSNGPRGTLHRRSSTTGSRRLLRGCWPDTERKRGPGILRLPL
jgi:16S rRNA (cytosine1402-N4)-methyltransferase